MKTLIIIPAYNESKRLPIFLNELLTFNRDNTLGDVTIRVVDDGSKDEESISMQKAALKANVQFERSLPNKGKGCVLRDSFIKGLSEKYDIVGFLDADGATSFYDLGILLKYLIDNKDVDTVIGSRWKSLGRTVERPLKRHLSGRIFATLVSNIFDIPVYDSQCGAKLFRTKTLSEGTLNFCDNNRWLFDTQLLILLYKQGYRIVEHPVSWSDKTESKVSLVRDSIKMFYGLIRYKNKLDSCTERTNGR